MPDKLVRMTRSRPEAAVGATVGRAARPIMLAVCGDSASGKTTLTTGLVAALGPERCTSVGLDDYHRFDRRERRGLPFTASHPGANYVDIMEQHLQMLAIGQPILKPVYDHTTGTLGRPEYVEPREFVIVEGLLPLSTKLSRACFDISVFLDPPEPIRRVWKIHRDTTERGYTLEEAVAELDRREADSAAYIRPQRRHADIVVRFAPDAGLGEPLSAELLLRSTVRHPPLAGIVSDDVRTAIRLEIVRDSDGTPADCLHVHGHAAPEEIALLKKAIWGGIAGALPVPDVLGEMSRATRSEPLAVTQLMLLYHLAQAAS